LAKAEHSQVDFMSTWPRQSTRKLISCQLGPGSERSDPSPEVLWEGYASHFRARARASVRPRESHSQNVKSLPRRGGRGTPRGTRGEGCTVGTRVGATVGRGGGACGTSSLVMPGSYMECPAPCTSTSRISGHACAGSCAQRLSLRREKERLRPKMRLTLALRREGV
jgi:hypothetical protein